VLITEAEHDEFKQAADASRKTVSSWMRDLALDSVHGHAKGRRPGS